MEYTKQIKELGDVPFGKEFQAYLVGLASAVTGKPKPPSEFIHNLERENSIFVTAGDTRNIMKEMKALFKEEGYMPHKEFENKLMQRLCPDLTAEELEHADHVMTGEYAPDPLTGFLQKPLVPLSTAEAWLYADSTGQPAHMLEIDFSNMRGTNEHYEAILTKLCPDEDQDIISERAMKMTDHAARHVCDAIINTIETGTSGSGKICYSGLRTGGDEARIIISGVEDDNVPGLIEKIHNAIEDKIKAMDLQNHPHAKEPENEVRNGFGAAISAIKLNGMNNLAEAIKDADEEIKAAKHRIGLERLKEKKAEPEKNITDKIKQDFKSKSTEAAKSGISSIFGKHVPDRILSLEEIRETAFQHLKKQLEQNGHNDLSPTGWRLLETKIARAPAMDYSSGTLMPRDQPAIVSIFRDVLAKQQTIEDRDDPPVLHGLGISLHNLSGLNETLGHEAANACLYHTANEIIKPALHKQGIPDSHFTLAHYGGGEFRAIIKDPRVQSGHEVSDETMIQIARDIKTRISNLNNSAVPVFLARYRINLDKENHILMAFRDIPHGKPDQRPWNNGLSASIATMELPIFDQNEKPVRAGAMLHQIGRKLEEKGEELLATKRPRTTTKQRGSTPRPSGGGNSQ